MEIMITLIVVLIIILMLRLYLVQRDVKELKKTVENIKEERLFKLKRDLDALTESTAKDIENHINSLINQ